jgi:putative transposase
LDVKKRFSEEQMEAENTRLKKLLAEQIFENDVIKEVLRKKP